MPNQRRHAGQDNTQEHSTGNEGNAEPSESTQKLRPSWADHILRVGPGLLIYQTLVIGDTTYTRC